MQITPYNVGQYVRLKDDPRIGVLIELRPGGRWPASVFFRLWGVCLFSIDGVGNQRIGSGEVLVIERFTTEASSFAATALEGAMQKHGIKVVYPDVVPMRGDYGRPVFEGSNGAALPKGEQSASDIMRHWRHDYD